MTFDDWWASRTVGIEKRPTLTKIMARAAWEAAQAEVRAERQRVRSVKAPAKVKAK